jgi:hypothetical protein
MAGWQAAVAVVASVVGGAAILWPVLVELEVRKCERPKYTLLKTLSATGATVAVGAKAARGSGGGVVELRRYAPILVAEAPIDAASMKEAGSMGFRRLAGFIFGKNVAKEAAGGGGGGGTGAGAGGGDSSSGAPAAMKVAMTSPVIMEMSNEKVAMTSPVVLGVKDGGVGEGGVGGGGGGGVGGDGGRIRATMAFTMPSKYTKDTLPTPLDDQVKVREVPARIIATLAFRGSVRTKDAYEKPAAALRAALQGAGIATKGPLEVYQYYPPFTWSFLRINEVAYEVEDVGEAAAASK